MRIRSRRRDARAGFTFMEMLIAVGIILVLIALSGAAILRFRNVGPYRATEGNLGRLKEQLDLQWNAVRDKAERGPIDVSPGALGVTSLASPQAKANFASARLAQAFPISFIEVFVSPGACGAWQPYRDYLTSLGVTPGNCALFDPVVQQSVCLLMILERGPSSTGFTRDQMGTTLANQIDINPGKVVGLPNGQTIGCVDGWGRGLLFSRAFWRTGNNTLGLVSMGANAKAGVVITPADAGTHSLKPNPAPPIPNSDADDNVVNPNL